jgi:hypothetical protein
MRDPVEHRLTATLATEHRRKDRDGKRIADLRQQIAEAKAEAFVRKALALAPPLSNDARARLASLLTGPQFAALEAGEGGGDAAA